MSDIPPISDIISDLSGSPVYVAPGVSAASSNMAITLTDRLTSNDHIVMVILPADSDSTPEELQTIAQEVSNGLPGDQIVSVAVGDDSYYAAAEGNLLPSGVAEDLMTKADTVSQNPLDTMSTFARNVHDYQRTHPETVAVPPGGSDNSANMPAIISISSAVLLAAVVAAGITIGLRAARRRVHKDVRYNGPRQLKDLIQKLMNIRSRIRNQAMTNAIDNVCRYVEAYFSRMNPDKRWNAKAVTAFENHLGSVLAVVERYVDLQNYPEYYEQPTDLQKQAVGAVADFGQFVLASIRTNNRSNLTNFTVDTQILSAQRFR